MPGMPMRIVAMRIVAMRIVAMRIVRRDGAGTVCNPQVAQRRKRHGRPGHGPSAQDRSRG